MRNNIPVLYGAELYDQYTVESVAAYDDAMIRRLRQEIRLMGRGPRTLIDIGTGTAQLLIKIATHPDLKCLRMTGTDYFEDMLQKARETVQRYALEHVIKIAHADVHDMPYPDDCFDFVISRSTIHHWASPVKAFHEIYRILTPGGVAIIHEPRRDPNPEALAEFNRRRQEVGVVPTTLEEKYTPEEVKQFLKEAHLHRYSIVSAPSRGPGSLGFEVRISKCNPLKVYIASWIAKIKTARNSW